MLNITYTLFFFKFVMLCVLVNKNLDYKIIADPTLY